MKKALATKSMNIPTSVVEVLTAVFIEKKYTMKEMKAINEMAFLDYRKWFREQKKKSKKDPIPPAKTEIAKVFNIHWIIN